MRKIALLVLVLAALLAMVGSVAAGDNRNFVAHLSGGGEVPSNDSLAQGQAIFHLSADGSALEYKLIVANLDSITQAHIHCGAEGVNGPIVVFLFPLTPAGVSVNGILAEGTIRPGDIIPRPDSAACPGGIATFDDLIAKMQSGGAYVNAHTTALPGGEIRGQIH